MTDAKKRMKEQAHASVPGRDAEEDQRDGQGVRPPKPEAYVQGFAITQMPRRVSIVAQALDRIKARACVVAALLLLAAALLVMLASWRAGAAAPCTRRRRRQRRGEQIEYAEAAWARTGRAKTDGLPTLAQMGATVVEAAVRPVLRQRPQRQGHRHPARLFAGRGSRSGFLLAALVAVPLGFADRHVAAGAPGARPLHPGAEADLAARLDAARALHDQGLVDLRRSS